MEGSAGKRLKSALGLGAFPVVKYARLLGVGGLRVYFVFFDSRVPGAEFTSRMAFGGNFPAFAAFAHGSRLGMANLLPIEDWRGTEDGSLFVRVDMSGRFAGPARRMARESAGRIIAEDMTLADFSSPDAIDAMTRRFRTARRNLLGKETARVRLAGCRWSVARDWAEFSFKSISTPRPVNGRNVWGAKRRTSPSPSANFALLPNRPKVYTLVVRLDKFFTWMNGTLPDGKALSMRDMTDAMKACPVRLWSDSPAFHWQGLNYNMSQMGCSLHPTSIAPKKWSQPRYHGPDGMLDKHLGALARNIHFFANQMAAALNSRLAKAGVIGGVKYNFQP